MDNERCFACGLKKELTYKLLWMTLDDVDYLCDNCREYFKKHHPDALVEKIEK
jgi:hypothetical protein